MQSARLEVFRKSRFWQEQEKVATKLNSHEVADSLGIGPAVAFYGPGLELELGYKYSI
jgi:hypothetical protein